MLVIGRKLQESVIIEIPPSTEPRVIEVQLVRVDIGKARIGFEADRDVNIVRKELLSPRDGDGSA